MPPRTDNGSVESLLPHLAPDAMLLVDQSGRISQANALAEQLFGYPPGALTGQLLAMLIPQRLRDSHQQHVIEYLRDPLPRPMGVGKILSALRRDGSEFAAEISLNPLATPMGLHILAAIRDATEHRRARQALEQATVELERQMEIRNADLVRTNAELCQQIAERAQIEAALRETETLYRQLVENQPDLICRFLPDTTLTFVNTAYARFFDRQPEKLVGQRFIEFLCVEDRAELLEQLATFTPAAPARQYEHKTIRADGVARWHLWNDCAFFDDQGGITGFQSVGVDITGRKQVEQELREAHRFYQQIINSTEDGILVCDANGLFTLWNPAMERISGAPIQQVLGKRPVDLFPFLVEQGIYPLFERAMAGEATTTLDYYYLSPGARRPLWVANNYVPLRDLEGRVIGVVGTVRDITERKQAEEALRKSEERLTLALRAANAGAWEWNAATNQAIWSDDNYRVMGLTPGSVESSYENWLRCVHPDDRAEAEQQVAQAMERTGDLNIEFRVVWPNGDVRWLNDVGEMQFDLTGQPVGMYGIQMDITERKQAEEALAEAEERAQITLHSIGDAVITTDAGTVVDYLNPVAEALTGWSLIEARGRPLQEVFQIVNEHTRQPAPNPVVRCLQEGKIVGLANHSVLLGRHGQEYHVDDSAAPIRGRDGRVLGAVLVFHDVTETRQLTRQLEYDATHDALTGLINRTEFERRLARALASAQQYGVRHALCYLDLDQFKIVNDTAGHAAGDELLRQINTILSGMFRERDTLARIGGDEFGLLLDNCPLDRAQLIAQTVVGDIRDHRFHWEGRVYQIGVSIGLTPITADAQDTAQLLTQADVACYIAKEMGRNRVHLYQREDTETVQRHGEILGAAGLRDSLEQGRFRLHYQPIVPLDAPDPRPSRYEVLLRVVYKSSEDANTELVLPAAFIPAAERYGMMGAIDRWVIQTAFREYANGVGQTGAQIAINLSGNSLSDETLLGFIEAQFTEQAFPPERVCFEITETAAIQNLRPARELMAALKCRGSQFALDDFGSGLSSFRYLKTLPVDYLKIDGSFVKDMIENPNDCALVAAINQMSHALGIQTIAEYVESQAIAERLRELKVDYAQGFFFGHAAPWGQLPRTRRSFSIPP